MTKSDAIYWLKDMAERSRQKYMPNYTEALDTAIDALSEPKWTCTANFVAEQLERLKQMTDEERLDFLKRFFSPSTEPSKVDYRTDESAKIGTEVNDLISRADAIDALYRSSVYSWSVEQDQSAHTWALNIIAELPSADRPQGEWIDAGQYPFDKCSICGQTVDSYDKWNFCPNCGAEMYVPVQEVKLTDEALEKMRGAE